ncbi:hypothetical protein GE300_09520 [Rhodobacteraceae bacterium 2CG4]|uniref:Uncharacterized protein n=1 Tax=Halovulum marinum TaxID=2662447 RepID=A0A6L5YZZ5_9RHOB|nr:hypothetical protein [Halovulum marinum]MSU89851.1 hypothetical protein [Halovulum marinum]
MAARLQAIGGAGDEVFRAVEQLQAATADPVGLSLEDARERLTTIAEAIGLFGEELAAIDAAEPGEQAAAAYAQLADRMADAAKAGDVLRSKQFAALSDIVNKAGSAEEKVQLMQAALEANEEELVEIVRRLEESESGARGVAGAAGTIDFSGAAASAGALADQLGRALANAQGLATSGLDAVEQARIELEFEGDPLGKAGALAAHRFDSQVNVPTEILDNDTAAVLEGERTAYINAAVEAEKYRQQLAKVREERAKAGQSSGGGGGSKAKAKTDEPSILDISQEQITQLERQIELIGKTDAEIAELTHKYLLLDEAKRRKLDLDEREIETGQTLRDLIDQQAATVGRLTEEQRQGAQQAEFYASQTAALKDGIIDAIVEGENFIGTLGNIAKAFAKVLLQAALFGEGPLATLFGQEAGKGLLSGLPFFARGTNFAPGGPAVVGERGPEIVNLPRGRASRLTT